MKKKIIFYFFLFSLNPILANAELQLFVASSLKKPMDAILADYQKKYPQNILAHYGASGMLYTQIINGQNWDLFFSADKDYTDKLNMNNKLSCYKFLTDHIVFASPKNSHKINRLDDIKNILNLNLAVASEAAPLGVYTRKALSHLELWEFLNKKNFIKATPPTANNVAMLIQENKVEAGFVYNSAARIFDLRIVEKIHPSASGTIHYSYCINKNTKDITINDFLNLLQEKKSEFTKWGWAFESEK